MSDERCAACAAIDERVPDRPTAFVAGFAVAMLTKNGQCVSFCSAHARQVMSALDEEGIRVEVVTCGESGVN